MASYSIGMSGLDAAQKALDIIGNNIANAATEGYHRQKINLTPAYSSQTGSILLGGGVNIAGVTRVIDNLLEQELLRQQSSLGQISTELTTLRTVENAFAELSTSSGLNAAIDEFFNALQDLSAYPTDPVWQNQAVTAAETMASQFRTLGEFLTTLETQIRLEAENVIEQINTLTNKIANLNDNIERIEISGQEANNMRDQRDQAITELSELVSVQIQNRDYGVVDVSIDEIPVVTGASVMELEVGIKADGSLGITIIGANNVKSDVHGGRLGGLLSLKNNILADIHKDLDSLASAIIQQINQYHVQGVGTEGSFTELTGWVMESEDLADFDPPVTSDSIYIRVTNTSTGQITRNEIVVDAANGSLSDIATAISLVTGLTASVISSKLHIQADANYEFDFLPAVLPTPVTSTLTGASPPTISVSGIYTGTTNQTFTFTVIGTGSVGNGTLQLEVKDGNGDVITTLNVGSGYAAGDKLDIGNGIKISLSTGDLNANDTFSVDAFDDTDTSGVLAAVGINAFFFGSSAENIAVRSEIINSPGLIATALGADMTDNANALRLAGLKDQSLSSLNALSPGEFYRRLVTDIGQQVWIKQISQDNIEGLVQNLAKQQGEISGVDINEEAAQLLIFEQMFQAMARYLNTVQSSMAAIMELI